MDEPETPAAGKPPEPTKPPPANKLPSYPLHRVVLADALGASARAERRNVLAASVAALLVTMADLVPEKIGAFGIDLGTAQTQTLAYAFAIVLFYFLVVFVVYARGDYLTGIHGFVARQVAGVQDSATRQAQQEQTQATKAAASGKRTAMGGLVGGPGIWAVDQNSAEALVRERFPTYGRYEAQSLPAAVARGVVDYVIPVGLGVWAIVALLLFAHHLPTEAPTRAGQGQEKVVSSAPETLSVAKEDGATEQGKGHRAQPAVPTKR